jgi:fibronectin-binding autotransporter adhesin
VDFSGCLQKPMKALLLRTLLVTFVFLCASSTVFAQRQMESLNRGVIAVRKNSTQIYVSWRLFGNDPAGVAFNLYRTTNNGAATKLNATPITATTDYTDTPGSTNLTNNSYAYHVRPVIDGMEQSASETAGLPAAAGVRQFLTLPLASDTGPNGPYDVKFAWVGDLDGDGDYDYVVDRLSTLGAFEQYLEAYKNDGTLLWRVNMGPNSVNQYTIEPGSSAISVGHCDHVTVYDLDGDGKSEVILKTANGTILGNGSVVTAANNTIQYISILDGLTGVERPNGRAVVPNPYTADGPIAGHFGILYLDGKRPSFLFQAKNRKADESFQGIITTWDYRNNQLTQRWSWLEGSLHSPEGHQIRIADVDNDGKDEFCDIGYVMDDDGTQLFNIPEVVHGDRFHIADIDPDRPGLETFIIQQNNGSGLATAYFDSGSGEIIRKWYAGGVVDVGRGIALDINSANKGYEMYSTQPGIFNAKAKQIYTNSVWAPEGLWWDGDLGREFIDGAGSGALNPVINKFNATSGGTDRVWSLYNDNGAFSTRQAYGGRPAFWGDILGDWREELVLVTSDYTALRIYTTAVPATSRINTLMHNPQYRMQATTKGYTQANYVDYYLGFGMSPEIPPAPMVAATRVWKGGASGSSWDVGSTAAWTDTAGAAATYADGGRVLFDLSGGNASPVVLSGSISPEKVDFYSPTDYIVDGSSGSLEGAMTLVKSGSGKVTLTGSHSYTGATTIWDGGLVVNGQLTSSPVTVWGGTWGGAPAHGVTGGRLSGSGTVSQPVSLKYRGAIAPGAGAGSAGVLTLSSSLTTADGAVLALDLSNSPTGANDRITVAGNLSITGKLAIDITATGGPLSPGAYTLLTYGGTLTGNESNLSITLPVGTAHTLSIGGGAITLTIPVTRAPGSLTWSGGNGGNAWDLATTANWLRSGNTDSFVSGDQVNFDDSGLANPNIVLTTGLPVSGLTVNASGNYLMSGDGWIAGSGGLVKSGTGTLTLNTTNTYTGPTTISAGVLAVDNLNDGGSASSIGASGTAAANLVINGGTLRLTGSQTNTNRSLTLGASGGILDVATASSSMQISGVATGTGKLTKNGPGTLIFTRANTFSGGTLINGGTIYLANATANSSGLGSGTVTISNGTLSMANVQASETASWNLVVPAGGTARVNADGRCQLNGSLTGGGDLTFYTPYVRTEIDGNWSAFTGRIFVVSDADGGNFRIRNSAGLANAALDIGEDVYAFYNLSPGSNVTYPIGTLSGNATGYLAGCNSASRTITWQVGARNEDSVFAGVIANATGPSALAKVGTGVLTLSGASTYTGATTVSAGTLRMNGSSSASSYTVQNGARLSGSGSITGNVTVQAGGSIAFGVGAAGANHLSITGNLSISGNVVVSAELLGGALADGNYQLLSYTGTLSGNPNYIWSSPAGTAFDAIFTHTPPSGVIPGSISVTLVTASRGPAAITWTGGIDMNWDSGTLNWNHQGAADTFRAQDSPLFSETGTGTAINLIGTLEPALVTVNATKNYSFAGAGQITGTGGLTKAGSGTLTMGSNNSYTGSTTISGGTVVLGSNLSFTNGGIGTGPIVFEGGTLSHNFATANTVIYSQIVSVTSGQTGTILTSNRFRLNGAVTGAGTLNMAINTTVSRADFQNTFSGFSGNFHLTGSGGIRLGINSLGTNQPLFDAAGWAGTTLSVDGVTVTPTITSARTIQIGALASTGSGGTLGGGTGGLATWSVGAKNLDTTYSGILAGANSALTKTGDGTLTLAGANTYTGATAVNNGKLSVTGSLAATAVTVATTGKLGGTGSIGGAVTCHGTLAPGISTGVLTLSSGLVLSPTAALEFELGSASDRAAVTGNLTIDGMLHVSAFAGFGAGSYTLLNYTGSLTDNVLEIGTLPSGYNATISTATAGQVSLVVTQAVVPASVTLTGLTAVYDGTPKPVSTITDPSGLAVTVTYDGSATVPTQPGSYAVAASISTSGYQGSATDTLVIAPRSFEHWAGTRFTQQQVLAGLSVTTADPDGDGLSNLAEYALGGNPNAFTPPPPLVTDPVSLSITFQRPAWTGITYGAQAGSSLDGWQDLTLEVISSGTDPETVRATHVLPDPKPAKTFLRLTFSR